MKKIRVVLSERGGIQSVFLEGKHVSPNDVEIVKYALIPQPFGDVTMVQLSEPAGSPTQSEGQDDQLFTTIRNDLSQFENKKSNCYKINAVMKKYRSQFQDLANRHSINSIAQRINACYGAVRAQVRA